MSYITQTAQLEDIHNDLKMLNTRTLGIQAGQPSIALWRPGARSHLAGRKIPKSDGDVPDAGSTPISLPSTCGADCSWYDIASNSEGKN